MSEETILNQETTTTTPEIIQEEIKAPESNIHDFKALLDEDLREDPSLKDIKDVKDLAKGYVSAQRMIGNSIRIPGPDAGKEQFDEFFRKLESVPGVMKMPTEPEEKEKLLEKLGRPQKAEEYQIELPKGIEDGTGAINQFKLIAHKAGLTNDQAKSVMDFYINSLVTPQMEIFEKQKVHGEEVLKGKWGADYKVRMTGAINASKEYAKRHPEAMSQLLNSPVGNNPAFIEMLSDLGVTLQESGVITGESKLNYGLSREEAMVKANEIMKNKEHPYWNAMHPEHQAAKQKVDELFKAAYPDEG